MKLKDIQVGGRYLAKVSGTMQVVRVVELKEVPPAGWSTRDHWRTVIHAVNEATGRRITVRSPQRLRPLVVAGTPGTRPRVRRTARRGRLTGLPTGLDGALVEVVRTGVGTITVRLLEAAGAYAIGDEVVVNQYEFVADGRDGEAT